MPLAELRIRRQPPQAFREEPMRQILVLTAALAMLSVAAAPASAQKIDKNGRCHDKAGKFAKDAVCAGGAKSSAAAPAAVAAADPKAPYKLDAKGKCHDVKGKMAAKAKCAA
jgi:hypothetical protein